MSEEREKWQGILASNRKERHDLMEKNRLKYEKEREEEEKRRNDHKSNTLKELREYKLNAAKLEAERQARAEALATQALEKKREAKIKRAREEQEKARALLKAEKERRSRIDDAAKASKEADDRELQRLQKELEIIEADKSKKTLVDINLDGKPLGRMVLQNGNMYEFNLETTKDEKPDQGELLVDLNINGKNGPIPKIVHKKDKKHTVWVDTNDGIENFETTDEKLKAINNLAEQIKGEIEKKDEKKDEKAAAQIGTEASSAQDTPVAPA